jgi:hypothetical protein
MAAPGNTSARQQALSTMLAKRAAGAALAEFAGFAESIVKLFDPPDSRAGWSAAEIASTSTNPLRRFAHALLTGRS